LRPPWLANGNSARLVIFNQPKVVSHFNDTVAFPEVIENNVVIGDGAVLALALQ
jgi:hypothetical protein